MGYQAGSVGGISGPNTLAALKKFQQAKGLEPTGRLNSETANALGIENGQNKSAGR
jgi:peptidoglycan hydrolase-like protein with peptidoglycan-binding domain